MSTPSSLARVAYAHATLSCRAVPPRRWSVAPSTGYRTSGDVLMIGQNAFTSSGPNHFGVDPAQAVRVQPSHRGPDVAERVREVQHAALAELEVGA